MSMTQGEAIASIRSRLDEPDAVAWDDSDLRRWINEILNDMARRCECLRGKYDEPAVVAQHAYTPAFTSTTQVFRVHRVEFVPDGDSQIFPLEYRDPNAADEVWGLAQLQTEGRPAIWTTWNAPPNLQLQVYPSPAVDGVFRIWYFRLATQLTISSNADENEILDMVEGWNDVLVDGVEYKAKRRDNDASWTEAKQEYEEHLDAMMQASNRFTDQQGQITNMQGLGIPDWLYGGDSLLL